MLIIVFFLCFYFKFEKKNVEYFLCNVLDYIIIISNGNEILKSYYFNNGFVDVIRKIFGF